MPNQANQTCPEDVLTLEEVKRWKNSDVLIWAHCVKHFSRIIILCLREQAIDGEVLLELTEPDIRELRYRFNYMITLGEMKKLWLSVKNLQRQLKPLNNTQTDANDCCMNLQLGNFSAITMKGPYKSVPFSGKSFVCGSAACRYVTPEEELLDCYADRVPREFFKTVVSLVYSFLVTWITSLTMVIVHERVPDVERYPPLPDIFLDSIPRIPWAFNLCEIVGTFLFIMWTIVCIFHRHRLVLLRRFFALAGTVFLLRCVTMLITSLSVPGTHLECSKLHNIEYTDDMSILGVLQMRLRRAYYIWSGMGLSIQGVRTCGDYMFSGHTCALTLLNFFITEYTPRQMYYLHTFTWILNMFGIFFILAAHEHYSIDVFVAFYITSRLFLYYHTLANNHALVSLDSTRTRIWFPMFFYFEKCVDGVVPNEFDNFSSLCESMGNSIIGFKDIIFCICKKLWWLATHLLNARNTNSNAPDSGQSFVDISTSFSLRNKTSLATLYRQSRNRIKSVNVLNEGKSG